MRNNTVEASCAKSKNIVDYSTVTKNFAQYAIKNKVHLKRCI